MNLAPEIIREVFEIVERPYAFRNELKLKSRKVRSVWYGICGRYGLEHFPH